MAFDNAPGEAAPDIDSEQTLIVGVGDARLAAAYLVARESDQYIAVMEVLESSVTDLTPREVAAALMQADSSLPDAVVEARLDQLRQWTAVSARTDSSLVRRHADLLARNWRYTATPVGRRVQRFYRTVLAGTPALREIPLSSLARAVAALEALVEDPAASPNERREQIGLLFTSHDDLDGALVGAEDALTGLVDRFDLDDADTAELKELLVSYATRVAVELEQGAARAHAALAILEPHFAELSKLAIEASEAQALISRGALAASRGGREEDWDGLRRWFDPASGRANRFALRLVRALPGMHANLRRLHTSSGTATGRARALVLARACADPQHGTSIFLAALGDHPWRKLYGVADDEDALRTTPWRDGPKVAVPDLLRATGRAGARGRIASAPSDDDARAAVLAWRERRAAEDAEAAREVLAASTAGSLQLSDRAGRLALSCLLRAVRSPARGACRVGPRTGTVTCTLWRTPTTDGVIGAPSWRIVLPGRTPVFHTPAEAAVCPRGATIEDGGAEMRLEPAA